MSALERQALKSKIGGLPPMPPPGIGGHGKRPLMRKRDYTPIHWDKYFERMHDVEVGENNTFRVYETGSEGPVLFFLHGGGFSALSWSLVSAAVSKLVTCHCAAIDLRGHGDTVTKDDGDLSAENLSSDVGAVIKELYGEEPPPIILIGHSMGGAIAVHTAQRRLVPSLIGLVVIDVVEGTALEALSSMQSFLRGRPPVFKSLEHAIEWCVRSGQIRNVESARVSMVGQLKRVDTEETATAEFDHNFEATQTQGRGTSTIIEEEEEDRSNANKHPRVSLDDAHTSQDNTKEDNSTSQSNCTKDTPQKVDNAPSPDQTNSPSSSPTGSHQYTWRIDLGNTEKYWKGWFEGLSQRFLSCEIPKMLLLAGIDRLDKDLTIGQMQGKFQMQVLPQCGHAVHEDSPEKVADVLATFMVRYKVAQPTADFHRCSFVHSSIMLGRVYALFHKNTAVTEISDAMERYYGSCSIAVSALTSFHICGMNHDNYKRPLNRRRNNEFLHSFQGRLLFSWKYSDNQQIAIVFSQEIHRSLTYGKKSFNIVMLSSSSAGTVSSR
ncbi:hypothetical protein FSP39_016513 [Pinctada imbricata]|uniref:protein phosphatase methylesterase-1 n=1 Tax=Pinctada imbricata TaxID=66713 RepID=A0AA89BZK7_PINIB|nr:hypothetical protein FSP39_016513 [Pinctada imbricata]